MDPFVVSVSMDPFVVSVSNHALRQVQGEREKGTIS
jgi:hypothetical protein